MDSCHAAEGCFDGDGALVLLVVKPFVLLAAEPLTLLVVDAFVLAWGPFALVGPTGESVGRPYFVYVQSCRIPRNAEKMRARVRINIPVTYVYGLVSADDDDWEAEVGWDAESVVKTTPSVTINTDRIWVNEYLGVRISASEKEKAKETHLLFETSQPISMLITNPPLLKMMWTGMGIRYANAALFNSEIK